MLHVHYVKGIYYNSEFHAYHQKKGSGPHLDPAFLDIVCGSTPKESKTAEIRARRRQPPLPEGRRLADCAVNKGLFVHGQS